ncbi:hypothetical protein BCR39DRAFT_215942 [Naematelia encephala]|uniref:Uncharacterized protein n=1 Tax=Naematelia encephala TaxID=71784 RepID=A0A1Y2AZ77_9TREE|nr:hypothetical protein BCR39DRAFT_215942 [Naematelia encephala]
MQKPGSTPPWQKQSGKARKRSGPGPSRWYIPATYFAIRHFNRLYDGTTEAHDPEYKVQREKQNKQRERQSRQIGVGVVQAPVLPVGPNHLPYYYSDSALEEHPPTFLSEHALLHPSARGTLIQQPLYDWGMRHPTGNAWATAYPDLAADVRRFEDPESTRGIPSYSHVDLGPGVVSCRRVCAVDMRYRLNKIPAGTYRFSYYFHFTDPGRAVDNHNPLFYPSWPDPGADFGDRISRSAYPIHIMVTQGFIAGSGRLGGTHWDRRWDPDAVTIRGEDFHQLLFDKIHHEKTRQLTIGRLEIDTVQAARAIGGWAVLVHSQETGVHMLVGEANREKAATLVLDADGDLLITISGFDAKWTGRWRFAGVRVDKLS